MFERITYISNSGCTIKMSDNTDVTTDLMNLHLIFEDNSKKILGEVIDIDGKVLKANFLGEISGDKLIGGNIRKPSLDSKIRIIDKSEIPLIMGDDTTGFMELGMSPLYDGVPVYLNVNNFFSNHFAIFGNTGSGKSCGVSRLFQNMFHNQKLDPFKANLFIIDSSGEYYSAFSNLNAINNRYNYRFISTNEVEGLGEKLRLPIYLLNKDDLALLLQCTSHSQLPIIERMLKLALVFSQNDVDAQAYKNHLIAKAIMSILYTNETSPNKRNEIFSILASCSTDEFNLEAPVQGIGYVRKFRECFLIDNSGNFSESVLLTEYVNSFIKEEYDSFEPHTGVFYDLDTLEKALNFTLISEGWLRNEQTYGDSVTLKVRLHALIVGDNAKYFDVKDYVSLETYLSSLLIENGKKYQIVNINLSDIDDDFAKVLTKIYSRLIFDFAKGLKNRGSIPFHIILEEAHRYIQADHDRFLFGYNIFERIAKEGRKYGVILGIITQRPVELSDNVISQCTNFLIFKINHPVDIKYIREMVPHITDEIIEKQKSLQPGTCLGFGLGFKIPLIVKMEMPNPSPLSGNCDVVSIWCGTGNNNFFASPANLPITNDLKVEDNIPDIISNSTNDDSINHDFSLIPNIVTSNNNSNSNENDNFSSSPLLVNIVDDSKSNSSDVSKDNLIPSIVESKNVNTEENKEKSNVVLSLPDGKKEDPSSSNDLVQRLLNENNYNLNDNTSKDNNNESNVNDFMSNLKLNDNMSISNDIPTVENNSSDSLGKEATNDLVNNLLKMNDSSANNEPVVNEESSNDLVNNLLKINDSSASNEPVVNEESSNDLVNNLLKMDDSSASNEPVVKENNSSNNMNSVQSTVDSSDNNTVNSFLSTIDAESSSSNNSDVQKDTFSEVPEISNFVVGSNGMTMVDSIDKLSTDLTLDDVDDDDSSNDDDFED